MKKKETKEIRQRKYLAKDFDGLRQNLLEYARQYYPDRLRDFSEASLGGLFLDLAAYVGDNMSFYLDHQFAESFSESAVETKNIERHLRDSGIKISGSAPSVVPITIYIQVPPIIINGISKPNEETLPVINEGTTFSSGGVVFTLLERIDFSKKSSSGSYRANLSVGQVNSDGSPKTYIMSESGLCISGSETTETFNIDGNFTPFRELKLSNSDVTEITSVTDGLGNIYYEVDSLTHDVVYKNVIETESSDQSLKLVPAPYRFETKVSLDNRSTTLVLGGGNGESIEDDIIPDPSEFAITFPYSKTFSRISINPQKLLKTKTLGVYSINTTISVNYRHGGGLNHNVPEGSIRNVQFLDIDFPRNPPLSLLNFVRSSLEVRNEISAKGGEARLTSKELKELIPSLRNSQSRIVTRDDLLARVYSIPTNFGKVFRAAVKSNPNNPLSSQLYIVSRDNLGNLTNSSDMLKDNLKRFLNPYRTISEGIDILDSRIVNIGISFEIIANHTVNKTSLLQNVLDNVSDMFLVEKSQIDQPIVLSEIKSKIYNSSPEIISVNYVNVVNKFGTINNVDYNDVFHDISSNTIKDIVFPPPGGIFELRYPEIDIIGVVS